MDDESELVAIIVGVFIAFVVIAVLVIGQRRRASAAKKFAKARGWAYTEVDRALPRLLKGPSLDLGTSQRTVNVVRGQHRSREALSAEYLYDTVSTDGEGQTITKVHRMQVAGVQLARPLLRIVVVPRGALERVASKTSRSRHQTGDPQFDKAFEIELADPKAVETLLSASVRRYCLENASVPFAVRGDWAFTWKKGKRNLKKVEKELDYLDGLVQRIPTHLAPRAVRKTRRTR